MATDTEYTPTQAEVDTALAVLEFMLREELNRLTGTLTDKTAIELLSNEAGHATDLVKQMTHSGWERLREREQ